MSRAGCASLVFMTQGSDTFRMLQERIQTRIGLPAQRQVLRYDMREVDVAQRLCDVSMCAAVQLPPGVEVPTLALELQERSEGANGHRHGTPSQFRTLNVWLFESTTKYHSSLQASMSSESSAPVPSLGAPVPSHPTSQPTPRSWRYTRPREEAVMSSGDEVAVASLSQGTWKGSLAESGLSTPPLAVSWHNVARDASRPDTYTGTLFFLFWSFP